MPQKRKTGEAQPNLVVAGALKSDSASGRTRKPAPGSRPAKNQAVPGLKSRSFRGSANLAAGSPAGTEEHRAPVFLSGSSSVTKPVPEESKPAGKTGAKKRTATTVAGRSSSARTRSTRKTARAAGAAKQPETGGQVHSEDDSRIDGNDHFDHDEIARLAYSYWEARGYQAGSPEEDWYRAQAELRLRSQQSAGTKPGKRARKA